MSALKTCPKCGKPLKFGRVKQYQKFTEKRRDCTNAQCGYGDKVHVHVEIREELLAIIEVAKRAKAPKSARGLLVPHKQRRNVILKAEDK